MIGNDVVDLNLARHQSNWRRKGYLDKIYTSEEQLLIAAAVNTDQMVWLLWSMKESAYKIHNRKTGIRNFAPTALGCKLISLDSEIKGVVTVDHQTYFTKSEFSLTYVHTIASASVNKLPDIVIKIYSQPNHPADYKSLAADCVSHHGRYLALVYG